MAKVGAPPGNTNAVRDNRLITDTLRKVCVQGVDKLRTACEKVLDDAEAGNLASLSFIADRLDGKPTATVDGTLEVVHEVRQILLGDLEEQDIEQEAHKLN